MAKNLVLIFIMMFFISLIYGCNNILPVSPKPTVPSDHNNNINGSLHKGSSRENMTPDECNDCHSTDIRGKVSLINGVYTWAPSCYQCHGAVWGRGGGTGGWKINDKTQSSNNNR